MEATGRIEMLRRMLEAEPNDVFLNYALGLEFARSLDTLANAETQFRLALEINPDYIAAYYQLGKLFELLLRNKEAIEFYEKGLEKAKALGDKKASAEFEEAIFLLD